jgi:NADH dehydrogenase FAD-containing subunit
MGCGSSSLENKKVIVVGGGYTGTTAAKELDGLCDVTLITPNDQLEHKWAYMRASVVSGWEKVTRVPLDKLLKRGKIIRGSVTAVSDGSVTLASGKVLTADSIILAHGYGTANLPGGTPTTTTDSASFMAYLKEKQKAVSAAKTILIAGGGPVGVELAGEIIAQYPNKSVKLVHSRSTLLSNSQPPMSEKMTTKLTSAMQEMGVEVILNAKVTNLPSPAGGDGFVHGKQSYSLSNGTTIDADLAVVCIGGEKQESNIVASVDKDNRVKVLKTLQVEGMPTVFCVGDANNVKETKLGYYGQMQAAVAVKNIQKLAQDKQLAEYKPSGGEAEFGTMFIPLGPKRGVGGAGKNVMGDFLVSKIKGKGLFKNKVFGGVNAVAPAVP